MREKRTTDPRISLGITLPESLISALDTWRVTQEVIPNRSRVIELAVREFLTKRNLLQCTA